MGNSRSILSWSGPILTVLLLASGCTRPSIELNGRPCEDGKCIDGFSCHPETDHCVPELIVDCNNDGIDDVCEDEFDAGFDGGLQIGLETGFLNGAASGDISGDGTLNITDIVQYVSIILSD